MGILSDVLIRQATSCQLSPHEICHLTKGFAEVRVGREFSLGRPSCREIRGWYGTSWLQIDRTFAIS